MSSTQLVLRQAFMQMQADYSSRRCNNCSHRKFVHLVLALAHIEFVFVMNYERPLECEQSLASSLNVGHHFAPCSPWSEVRFAAVRQKKLLVAARVRKLTAILSWNWLIVVATTVLCNAKMAKTLNKRCEFTSAIITSKFETNKKQRTGEQTNKQSEMIVFVLKLVSGIVF